jgi:hypothetical protein
MHAKHVLYYLVPASFQNFCFYLSLA